MPKPINQKQEWVLLASNGRMTFEIWEALNKEKLFKHKWQVGLILWSLYWHKMITLAEVKDGETSPRWYLAAKGWEAIHGLSVMRQTAAGKRELKDDTILRFR